MQLKVKDVFI